MSRIIIRKSAKSVDEAVSAALAELGVNKDKAHIKVIQEPKKGLLGLFGAKDAEVEVSINAPKTVKKTPKAEKPVKESKKNSKKESKKDSKKAEKPVKKETSTEDKKAKKPSPKTEKPLPKADKEPKLAKAQKADTPAPKTEKHEVHDTDAEIAKAKEFLGGIFKAMSLEVNIACTEDGDVLNIDLSGDRMGLVIGKRGDTLDALQYLTSIVINRRINLDTENFRERRTATLVALADRLAAKVMDSHKRYTLEPMNAYERRVIHAQLQKYEELTTYSIGDEPFRKVVISPKDKERIEHAPRRGGERRQKRTSAPSDVKPAEKPSYKPLNKVVHKDAPKPIEQPKPRPIPKKIEIPRPSKPQEPKAASFDEYLAKQAGEIVPGGANDKVED